MKKRTYCLRICVDDDVWNEDVLFVTISTVRVETLEEAKEKFRERFAEIMERHGTGRVQLFRRD
jgi:hypothetical protein